LCGVRVAHCAVNSNSKWGLPVARLPLLREPQEQDFTSLLSTVQVLIMASQQLPPAFRLIKTNSPN